jgi:hypothetical protein
VPASCGLTLVVCRTFCRAAEDQRRAMLVAVMMPEARERREWRGSRHACGVSRGAGHPKSGRSSHAQVTSSQGLWNL